MYEWLKEKYRKALSRETGEEEIPVEKWSRDDILMFIDGLTREELSNITMMEELERAIEHSEVLSDEEKIEIFRRISERE